MKITNVTSVFFLLVMLGLAAYLDSPYSIMNKNYAYTADQPVMAEPVEIDQPSDIPELVEKLEKREKIDGYIVEIYQEYEVYRDKDGNIIEEIPTSKTETLRYWDYKE